MDEERKAHTGHEILKERTEDRDELRDYIWDQCMYERENMHSALVRGRLPVSALQKAKFSFLYRYEQSDAMRTCSSLSESIQNKIFALKHDGYRILQTEFRDDSNVDIEAADIVFKLERNGPVSMRNGIKEVFSRIMMRQKANRMISLSQFLELYEPKDQVNCTRNRIRNIMGDIAYLRCLSRREELDDMLIDINNETLR